MNRHVADETRPDRLVTDLEELLSGEGGGDARKEIADRLRAKARRVRLLMEGGLSPNEYQRAKRVYEGLRAACETIMKL